MSIQDFLHKITPFSPNVRCWQTVDCRLAGVLMFSVFSMTCQCGIAGEFSIEVQLIPIESSIIAAARAGLIAKVHVVEGQSIQNKEIVAKLDSRHAELEAEKARMDLKVTRYRSEDDIDIRHANKLKQLANSELQRARAINAKIVGSISAKEIDALQLSVERAELALEQAKRDRTIVRLEAKFKEISLKIALLEVQQSRLLSPINGMIVKIYKQPGAWVESGESVLEVTPTGILRAEGFLEESLASLDLRGSPAVLRIGTTPTHKELKGKIMFIAPASNPVNGMVRFRAEFDRKNSYLRAGMSGIVCIKIDSKEKIAKQSPGPILSNEQEVPTKVAP